MLLFDHDTGQPVEVPDEHLTEALKSGRFTAPKGAAIPVVDATGQAGSVPAAEAYRLFNEETFRVETAAERTERQTQEKYGEGLGAEAAALGAGVARGATLGLSDAIVRGLGGSEAAHVLEELHHRNPNATLGGEILGAVAPAVLAGGAGAVGTAARFTPAGFVSRLGVGVEHGAARLLGAGATSAAGRIVQSIVPKIAGSAVEGAFYGAGGAITESALGDTELTAEHLLSQVGIGALVGGGSAAAVSLGGMVAHGTVKAAAKSARATWRAVEDLYERATGNQPVHGLGKMWAKVSGMVSGADDDVLQPLFTSAEARARAVKPESVLDDAAEQLREAYDEILTHGAQVTPEALGKSKLRRFSEVIKKGNEDVVADSAASLLNELGGNVDQMIEAGRGSTNVAGLPRLREVVDSYRSRIAAIAREGGDVNGRIYLELDALKRDVGAEIRKLRGSTLKDRAWRETFDALSDTEGGVYNRLKTHLEDKFLYGEAAEIQSVINQRWAAHLGPENYRSNFAVKMGSENFEDVYVANDTQFRKFVRELKHVDTNDYKYISHHVKTKRDLVEEIARNYDLAPEVLESVQALQAATEKFQRVLRGTKDDVVAINQLRELEHLANASVVGSLGGAGVGYLVGSGPGAVIGAGLGALARPGQTIRQLATLERLSQSVTAKVKKATAGFMRSMSRPAHFGAHVGEATARESLFHEGMARARRAIAPVSVHSVRYGEEQHAKGRAFEQRLKELTHLATEPNAIAQRLTESLLPIDDVAPGVAAAMAERAGVAVRFLHDKAPKPPPSVAQSLTPKRWRPSESDLARFNRYVQAVEDPLSALDSMRRGSLSQEQVETLREVYPKLHQSIVASLNESLAELRTELPREKRVQLSLFFGIPVDATMASDFVQLAQALHATEEQPAGQPAARTSRKVQSKTPDKHQTAGQRTEAR